MSFTSSIGLAALFFVDFIDILFISMLGNAAVAAAVGYAGVILFFTTSVSIGVSIAAGALVARDLGARKTQHAGEAASAVAIVGVLVAVVTASVALAAAPWLLDFLGAVGEVKSMAVAYLQVIVPSMPVLLLAMVSNAVLRAHGDARRAVYPTLAGGVVNAALDPLLIFTAGLGLQGAAIASVVARVVIFIVAVVPVVRVYNGFALPHVASLRRDIRAMAMLAFSSVAASMAVPVGAAIMTREVSRFGADAVAGMAIIGRLTPVAFAVVFSLSGAIGPVIGQNFGAGAHGRVRVAFFAGIKFILCYVLAIAVFLFLLRAPLAALFAAEGITRDLVYLFCGPLALAYFFNGVIFVGNATFNNLGHSGRTAWLNWGWQTLGTWPPAAAGAALAGAGGALVGQAAGAAVFALLSVWLVTRLMTANEKPPPPHHFHKHVWTHQLWCRRH